MKSTAQLNFIIMSILLLSIAPMISCAVQPNPNVKTTQNNCPDNDANVKYWKDIRSNVKDVNGNEYAIDLAQCLWSPNAILRDHVAYEVLAYWLRQSELTPDTRNQLTSELIPWLSVGAGTAGDHLSLARAFSALILSELVLADANDIKWSSDKMDQLVESSVKMFTSERDYRGLDPDLGWIHTIAHGSDLLWRLAQHPSTTSEHHELFLLAIRQQLKHRDTTAFVFNESDRIARVVVAIVERKKLSHDEIIEWLDNIASPEVAMKSWNDSFQSIQGMAELHNSKQFLRALRELLIRDELPDLDVQIKDLLAILP